MQKVIDEMKKIDSSMPIFDHKNEERTLLADCLFFIYYHTIIPPDEALKVVDLLFQCGSTATLKKTDEGKFNADFQVGFLVQ